MVFCDFPYAILRINTNNELNIYIFIYYIQLFCAEILVDDETDHTFTSIIDAYVHADYRKFAKGPHSKKNVSGKWVNPINIKINLFRFFSSKRQS